MTLPIPDMQWPNGFDRMGARNYSLRFGKWRHYTKVWSERWFEKSRKLQTGEKQDNRG